MSVIEEIDIRYFDALNKHTNFESENNKNRQL